jgi:hypothetical protein
MSEQAEFLHMNSSGDPRGAGFAEESSTRSVESPHSPKEDCRPQAQDLRWSAAAASGAAVFGEPSTLLHQTTIADRAEIVAPGARVAAARAFAPAVVRLVGSVALARAAVWWSRWARRRAASIDLCTFVAREAAAAVGSGYKGTAARVVAVIVGPESTVAGRCGRAMPLGRHRPVF